MTTSFNSEQQVVSSDGFFQKLASGVPGVLFTYWLSADGSSHHYPFVSHQVLALFGVDSSTLNETADAVFSIIHPEDAGDLVQTIQDSAQTLVPWRYRARLKLINGEYQWFEVHARPERQPDGSTVFYGQFHNIQHYKDLEQNLRESEAEFSFQAGFQKLMARLSTEFINLGFGTIDQCIEEVLKSIGEFFAVDRAYLYEFSDDYQFMNNTHEWCGDGVASIIGDQQAVPIEDFHWWHQQIGSMVTDNRVVFIEDVDQLPSEATPERSLLKTQGVCSMFCVPIRVRGKVTGFFGVDSLRRRCWREDQADLLIIVSGLLSGALDRFRLEDELLNQSIRDPLTGLHNRRYLMPRLGEMLGRNSRLDEQFTLAMFDIDQFKGINDSIGHLGGDYVLQKFAGILMKKTRPMDIVARFGGEEFIVIFNAVDRSNVRQLVLRMLETVRNDTFIFNGEPVDVTVSVGMASVAEFAEGQPTPDAMISLADNRLYQSKQAGRDCLTDASGTFRL
ncbi:diguanylate cyclase [Marinobacter confluentis]|uniref:diguanylate cyclase n=1 Tax=Marinobacter confluentis TaxID=1697557 RepID=A0A4Z1CFG0_9GAMM|nr:diguanylate cyclase [Marinobacter confluentis]TGN38804.1 diguanylate cyclase [Marinobacter confluentis]